MPFNIWSKINRKWRQNTGFSLSRHLWAHISPRACYKVYRDSWSTCTDFPVSSWENWFCTKFSLGMYAFSLRKGLVMNVLKKNCPLRVLLRCELPSCRWHWFKHVRKSYLWGSNQTRYSSVWSAFLGFFQNFLTLETNTARGPGVCCVPVRAHSASHHCQQASRRAERPWLLQTLHRLTFPFPENQPYRKSPNIKGLGQK